MFKTFLHKNRTVFLSLSVLFLLMIAATKVVKAQPQMAALYRQAAQAAREAAGKTKSAKNRSCYLAIAQYHDCLAAQLGPNGPRQCNETSCSLEAEPGGGSTGGNSAPSSSGQPAPQPTPDAQQIMDQMIRNREREREVEEQEESERDAAQNLKPKEINSGGAETVDKLLEGKDNADLTNTDAADRREEKYGKTKSAENSETPKSLDELAAEVDKTTADADSSNFAPEDQSISEWNKENNNSGSQSPSDKDSQFYDQSQGDIGSLYTPASRAKVQGWGESDTQPIVDPNDIPTTIVFNKDGTTVESYENRNSVPASISYNKDGTTEIVYGADASHPQPTSVVSRDGRVIAVKGVIDDRVPTVVTYGADGSVKNVTHGVAPTVQPVTPGESRKQSPDSSANNQNPSVIPQPKQPSDLSTQQKKEPDRKEVEQPQQNKSSCPNAVQPACDWYERQKNSWNEKWEEKSQAVREWYDKQIRQPVTRFRQFITNPLDFLDQTTPDN